MHSVNVIKILFLLGKYKIGIVGSKTLTDHFPPQWSDYLIETDYLEADLLLRLEEGIIPEFTDELGTWRETGDENDSRVVYAANGRSIFSLKYNSHLTEVTVCVRKALDNYVRIGLQYGILFGLVKQCIGLHGVTLRCNNQTIILSAPSGTGKTTLSHLLKKYGEASVINGDFALLSCTEEGIVFEPTPFCGTSRICEKKQVQIDRIVFLEQDKENRWISLSGQEAMIKVMSNSFIPSWDSRLMQTVLQNVLLLLSKVKVEAYAFTQDKEAAEVFYDWLQYS